MSSTMTETKATSVPTAHVNQTITDTAAKSNTYNTNDKNPPDLQHGNPAGVTLTDVNNRLVSARQRRILNLRNKIAQFEEELRSMEKSTGFDKDNQEEGYIKLKRRHERFKKTLEELLNDPIEFYAVPHDLSSAIKSKTLTDPSHEVSSLDTRFSNSNHAPSPCQSTSSQHEQSNRIQTPVPQTDVQSTVLLGEDTKPLDRNSFRQERRPSSDIGHRGSTATVTENIKILDDKLLSSLENARKMTLERIKSLYNEMQALEALHPEEFMQRINEYEIREKMVEKLEARYEQQSKLLKRLRTDGPINTEITNSVEEAVGSTKDLSKENQVVESPVKEKAEEEILERGKSPNKTEKHPLYLRKDDIGVYYRFTTKVGESNKYYPAFSSQLTTYELRTLEDFPNWCREVESFLDMYNFDNVIEIDPGDSIPDDENALLHRLLKGSTGSEMLRYFKKEKNVLKVLDGLRKRYNGKFTKKMRDEEWSRISIDKTCSDAEVAVRTLLDMVYKELYGNIGVGLRRRDNGFINELILETLEKSLGDDIRYNHRLKEGVLQKMMPTELIDLIADELLGYSAMNTSRGKQLCNKCKSPLHSTRNCKLPVRRTN